MIETLTKLETAVFKAEGIKDLLAMVAYCAGSKNDSLDNYEMGFWLLHNIAYNNVKELNELKNQLYELNGKTDK